MTTVDYIGLALELDTQAKRVESNTARRAMEAAANGLRLMGAALTQGAGAVEPDSREVVSDDELEQAFRNTNFGVSDHRTLLHVGVLKKACGYHCGHTITTIMTELGLIGIGGVPTKKGRRMMQIAYHAQMLKGP